MSSSGWKGLTTLFAVAGVLFLGCLFSTGATAGAADKFLALGTSSKSGVYFPVGKEICRRLNINRETHLHRCQALTTGGSVYNIQALVSGELDLAITRSDLAYASYNGVGLFKKLGAVPGIRAIATLYDNPVAVLVSPESNITDFSQLTGKRINIGNKGSGKRSFSDELFKIMGWKRTDFSSVSELSSSKMARAFCAGELDILIQAMGIPAAYYDKLVEGCGARFLSIPDDIIAAFKNKGPFFEEAVIPGGMYAGNPEDVRTIGTKALLVTSSRVGNRAVGEVAKGIFEDLAGFTSSHPTLQNSNAENMLKEGIFIPLHEGAAAYYRSRKHLAGPAK